MTKRSLDLENDDYSIVHKSQKTSGCSVCNGFYESCGTEPICKTCHLFIYSDELLNTNAEEFLTEEETEDSNTINTKSADLANNGSANPVQDFTIDSTMDEEDAPSEDQMMLENQLQLLSDISVPSSQHLFGSRDYIQDLPAEILLAVFSYLDEFSLLCVSKVCTRWNQLLLYYTPQSTWYKLIRKCWPLYIPSKPEIDWYSESSSLLRSSPCILCLRRMLDCPELDCAENIWRRKRLKHEMLNYVNNPFDGIKLKPFGSHLSHWQATILGPKGSPFEGGKFFLYLQVPYGYPISPPVVRFLTKIFHPNVSRHGDIGLDILQTNWNVTLTIDKLLISIQSLFTDPFCDVCMEPDIAQLYKNDRQTYNTIARNWTNQFAMN